MTCHPLDGWLVEQICTILQCACKRIASLPEEEGEVEFGRSVLHRYRAELESC